MIGFYIADYFILRRYSIYIFFTFTEDLTKLKSNLDNVKRDAEKRYREELDEMKNNYNEKVADMLHHIRNLDSELVEKGLLLNKTIRYDISISLGFIPQEGSLRGIKRNLFLPDNEEILACNIGTFQVGWETKLGKIDNATEVTSSYLHGIRIHDLRFERRTLKMESDEIISVTYIHWIHSCK